MRCRTSRTSACSAPRRRRFATPAPDAQGKNDISRAIADYDDVRLHRTVRNLGGHDPAALLEGYRAADAAIGQPSVVFAYTVKGWSLPTEGHPSNHSALLTAEQYEALAPRLGADARDPWSAFAPGTPEGELCARTARTLHRAPRAAATGVAVPSALDREHRGEVSTQQALGRLLTDLAHEAPETAKRIVTVRPTWRPRRTSAAGSTVSGSGRSGSASTGSPMIARRS